MVPPQAAPFQIRTPAQAEALMDFTYGARLLEQFMAPSTSSQAARALAQPANRVAYHVRKLMEAGLLQIAEHRGKRVLYQAVAQTFQVPRGLIRLDEPLTLVGPAMREITHAYAHAILKWQARRDPALPEEDASHLMVYLGKSVPEEQGAPRAGPPEAPYPPAMRMRTVRLTPSQYRQVQDALDRVLTDLATRAEDEVPAQQSTFVVMGFLGGLHET